MVDVGNGWWQMPIVELTVYKFLKCFSKYTRNFQVEICTKSIVFNARFRFTLTQPNNEHHWLQSGFDKTNKPLKQDWKDFQSTSARKILITISKKWKKDQDDHVHQNDHVDQNGQNNQKLVLKNIFPL